MKILFLLGKGGVGKSTLSSLIALHFTGKGKKVTLASLDPAHNLGDIFGKKLSDSETEIVKGLKVVEVDQEKWIMKYLKHAENQITKAYSYLTTFSLEKNFSVMQHAPALEEYAMHMAFSNILSKFKSDDFLIFDMPPTALALKFFALPQISLIWLKSLSGLRDEIFEKQKIISKLKLGEQQIETDRVKQNIAEQANSWNYIDSILKDEKNTFPVIVENPDEISQAEARHLKDKLRSMSVVKTYTVLNKTDRKADKEALLSISQDHKFIGLENIRSALSDINFKIFENVISN